MGDIAQKDSPFSHFSGKNSLSFSLSPPIPSQIALSLTSQIALSLTHIIWKISNLTYHLYLLYCTQSPAHLHWPFRSISLSWNCDKLIRGRLYFPQISLLWYFLTQIQLQRHISTNRLMHIFSCNEKQQL